MRSITKCDASSSYFEFKVGQLVIVVSNGEVGRGFTVGSVALLLVNGRPQLRQSLLVAH